MGSLKNGRKKKNNSILSTGTKPILSLEKKYVKLSTLSTDLVVFALELVRKCKSND